MKIIDGRKIAQRIKQEIKTEIANLCLSPSLHTIAIGETESSKIFLRAKEKACQEVGIKFFCHRFKETAKTEEVIELINQLNSNPEVTGILIQLPLRSPFQPSALLDLIKPEKDVDCLTSVNFGRFVCGFPLFTPPTVQAVRNILGEEKIEVKGKNIAVVGAGRIAGLPIAVSLLQKRATVTICHEFTKNLTEHTKKADILISATGQPGLTKGSMIKKGAMVIDVGTSIKDEKLAGDVELQSIKNKASFAAMVPGGVGPIMVACLLRNVLKAATIQDCKPNSILDRKK